MLRFPPRQHFLWAGIACGAIAGGLVAFYQCFWMGMDRADGMINAIQFGNLSLLLGLMCLVGLLVWHPERRAHAWIAVLTVGLLCGITGSLLSQSRGGWLALLGVTPVLIVILWRRLHRKRLVLASIAMLLASVALLSLMAQKLSDRIEQAEQEIQLYESTGNAATSVGQRLAHWKLAWQLGMSNPLVGWSQQGYEKEKKRLVAAGRIHPSVLQFNHAHNEFLDIFAKRGLLGLAAYLYLYWAVFSIFWPRDKRTPALGLHTIGVLIPVAYVSFSLTQGFLGHNSGTMFFLFMTVLIFSALQGELRACATAPP